MKSYFTVNDVIEILGVSRSKVPRNYFEKRWYGSREERMS